MPARTRELIPNLLVFVLLLSVSTLATQLPADSQGIPNQNRKTPNDNRIERPEGAVEKVLEGMKQQPAASQPAEQAKLQLRSELQSGFGNSLRETFGPDKVVMTCDAVEQLREFTGKALNEATDTGFTIMASGDKSATEQLVSTAQDRFKKFLEEQVNSGERLKDGHILVTGKSFNQTQMRLCPLIPICK